MSLRPGSLTWLLRHDLTISWRRLRGLLRSASNAKALTIVGLIYVSMHVAAWPLAGMMLEKESQEGVMPLLGMAFLVVMPWMLSQGLTGSTRALYSRGDLDLLLASPLAPRLVLASRALAVAIEGLGAVGLFLFPVIDMAAILGGARWLAVYPALIATVLTATGLSLALTLGLFRLLGPKKTRSTTQVLATLVGAWFVICAQIFNFMSPETRQSLRDALTHPLPGGWLDPQTALWLPVRAAAGDFLALAQWSGFSLIAFALAIFGLAQAFTHGALIAGGQADAPQTGSKASLRFRSERAGALRRKEWRLLARDPYLLSQVLLQSLYTLPVALIIWKSLGPNGSLALSVAPALVAIASQVAAALAFLAASSEEAGDFVGTAPVSASEILRRKLEAIALPVGLFLVLPLAGVAFANPAIGLVTLLFAIAAAASTASLNFWKPLQNRRGDLIKTHAQSKIVGLVEHGLSLGWAIAALLACLGQWTAVVPVAFALVLLWLNRPRRQAALAASQ